MARKTSAERIQSQRRAFEAMRPANLTFEKAKKVVRFYLTNVRDSYSARRALSKYEKSGIFVDKFTNLSQKEIGLIYAALQCIVTKDCGKAESPKRGDRRAGRKRSNKRTHGR